MEEITDIVFRGICRKMGADMVFTEFIASEALSRDVEKSFRKMSFNEHERPIGIQIFGNSKEKMVEAAKIAETSKPDIIDINWGCPVKKVASKGSGSGILKDIPKMVEITKEVVKSVSIPVSVKTRLGYDNFSKPIVEVTQRLQDVGIAAMTIHGRTRSQMYSGDADWELIEKVKNNNSITIPIIGNGDITNGILAKKRIFETGVDAIMIGRGAIGNPWIFRQIKAFLSSNQYTEPTIKDKIEICKEHLLKSVEYKSEKRAILEMRRHYSHYFSNIPNFKNFKIDLISKINLNQIIEIFDEIERVYT